MGRGRARSAGRRLQARALVLAGALAATALIAAGCGAESHPNNPRPGVSVRVSVTINPKGITVTPRSIGNGPAKTQQIPQNQNHPQPSTGVRGPLNVTFVTANQTDTDSALEVRGPTSTSSGPIFSRSPGSLQADLKPGVYTITAKGITSARPGKLVVGSYRASSENDVLLP
ncbi:MAG TPA: hypothetical protein VFX45_06350 [Solirubrobacterales bacterium]|nr:hypothetical protein [Solirubrobacterales bacterium]